MSSNESYKNRIYQLKFRHLHSLIAGFLLGIPIAYPGVPYYWLAFAVFGSVLIYAHRAINVESVALILLAIIASLLSNIFGLGDFEIQPSRILFTSAYFLFFSFGWLIPDRQLLLVGLNRAVIMLAAAVISLAMIIMPFKAGLIMFSVPSLRLWGAEYFPDWPNYLAFMLSIGFLLSALVYKRPIWAIINLTAALLTTSRTPLIAVALFFIAWFFSSKIRSLTKILLCVAVSSLGLLMLSIASQLPSEFRNRVLIFSDREEVYGDALNLFTQEPFFGHGSVLLDKSVGHLGPASYHNSYLDIAVRHGLVGFAIFILLIWPSRPRHWGQKGAYWALVSFFLIGSMFQNFLKHPHLVMIYSVILFSRGELRRES